MNDPKQLQLAGAVFAMVPTLIALRWSLDSHPWRPQYVVTIPLVAFALIIAAYYSTRPRVFLVPALILLVCIGVLTLWSVGLIYLPAVLFTLVAAIVGDSPDDVSSSDRRAFVMPIQLP